MSSDLQAGQTTVSPAGIKTAWIPPGTFTMGSPPEEKGRWDSQEAQRQVSILSGFWMGVYPVTQEEWTSIMGNNPSDFSNSPAEGERQGRRPVDNISWYDALVFANRLSILERLSPAYRIKGKTNPDHWGEVPEADNDSDWDAVEVVDGSAGWRLPTEAQWEYAARAGTTTAFNNGASGWEDETSMNNIGWFYFNSGGMTHEVGLKQPNPWGLHDIHGNVWVWMWDRPGASSSQAQTEPSRSLRMSRGGSWLFSAQYARSALRVESHPFNRFATLGLRLVRPSLMDSPAHPNPATVRFTPRPFSARMYE